MRRTAALMLSGWLVTAGAVATIAGAGAQETQPESGFVVSRQEELRQLAFLVYGIRLDRGTWDHHPVAACPTFSHHVFVRYDLMRGAQLAESFLAVYALDRGPAKSMLRPWEGGIVLVPLYGVHGGSAEPAAGRPETIADFNAVWLDERQRSAHPDNFPGLSWSGLAECYLRFAGEQPETAPDTDAKEAESIDLKGELIGGVTMPIAAPPQKTRAGSVEFDKHGLVTSGTILENPIPR